MSRNSSLITMAALLVALVGLFAFSPSICAQTELDQARAGLGEAVSEIGKVMPSFPDSLLTQPAEVGVPDEFGVALEDDDSIETSRVDIQERFVGIDRVALRPVGSTAAQNRRPSSSPLLV